MRTVSLSRPWLEIQYLPPTKLRKRVYGSTTNKLDLLLVGSIEHIDDDTSSNDVPGSQELRLKGTHHCIYQGTCRVPTDLKAVVSGYMTRCGKVASPCRIWAVLLFSVLRLILSVARVPNTEPSGGRRDPCDLLGYRDGELHRVVP